jgi:hypothetical protein
MGIRSRGRSRGRGNLGGGEAYVPPQFSELLQWFDGVEYDAGDGLDILRLDDKSGNGLYGLHDTSNDTYNTNPTANAVLLGRGFTNSYQTKAALDALNSITDTLSYTKAEDASTYKTLQYVDLTVLTIDEQILANNGVSRSVQYLLGVVVDIAGIVQTVN